jgi:ABC-type enterobactin transport system permease subunit
MTSKLHPSRALAYAKGRRKGNEIPALLWLYVALIGLLFLRNGGVPSEPSQYVTIGLGAGAVVILGSMVPTALMLVLVALLIGGVLGIVPAVTGILATGQRAIDDLASYAKGQP